MPTIADTQAASVADEETAADELTPRRRGAAASRSRPGKFLTSSARRCRSIKRMWAEDIRGSIAHARMLADAGRHHRRRTPTRSRRGSRRSTGRSATATSSGDIADEDIHMAIERVLTERIGPAGARLHTGSQPQRPGRHRHAHVREAARRRARAGASVLRAGARSHLAEEHLGVVMPGYTHLQKAQPVLFATTCSRTPGCSTRDCRRGSATRTRPPTCCRWAAPRSRARPSDSIGEYVAERLGFSAVIRELDGRGQRPRLPARSRLRVRGLPGAPLAACRGAHPLVERGVRLRRRWTTRSRPARSIMPQKKNPDFAELVRGKTGRVVGDLTALLVTLKGLPLAYNKDMQEDKEVAFDAIDTLANSLRAMSGMLDTLQRRHRPHARRLRSAASWPRPTSPTISWVAGVPFREAHEVVGRLVLAAASARAARCRTSPPTSSRPTTVDSALTCSTPSTSTRWSRAE